MLDHLFNRELSILALTFAEYLVCVATQDLRHLELSNVDVHKVLESELDLAREGGIVAEALTDKTLEKKVVLSKVLNKLRLCDKVLQADRVNIC